MKKWALALFLAVFLALLYTRASEPAVEVPEVAVTVEPTATQVPPTPTPTLEPTEIPNIPQTPLPSPTPTVIPTPTPTPVLFAEGELAQGNVRLVIPKIEVDAVIEVGQIKEDGSLVKVDPPVWVPVLHWSQNIGDVGLAVVYGERQWGPVHKVFTALDKLEPGDQVYVSSPDKTLIFNVLGTAEVEPKEIWPTVAEARDKAFEDGAKRMVLFTCTPWGTDWRRLFIFTELYATLQDKEVNFTVISE